MYQAKTKTKAQALTVLTNLKIIIFALSLLSILVYLVVVNRTNTMGIEIGQMKLKINQLQKENRDLESLTTQLQAMQRIEAIAGAELSMVQAATYDYVEEPGAVAVKE